jgi:hypothetical protein
MKRYLFSILLACVFLISPATYAAADVKAPTPIYQVDVTHSVVAIGAGSSDVVATMQRLQSVANIKLEPADTLIRISQYNSCKSITATGVIGAFGGDPIGISKPS